MIRASVSLGVVTLALSLLGGESVKGPETWLELMGGDVRLDGLTADLEAMKGAGISGVHLFHIFRGLVMNAKTDRLHPACTEAMPCAGPKWDAMINHVGKECQRLGLKLTVQNCPGWSQSGGPWIDLDHCMRELVVARADFAEGETPKLPEIPKKYRDRDSDWRDVAVMSFPTPEGDDNQFLKPERVEKQGMERIFRFASPVTVRSLVLPNLSAFNSRLAYHEPWLHVKFVDLDHNRVVLDTDLPKSNWRDYVRTLTLATEEATAKNWKYTLSAKRPVKKFLEPSLASYARQYDWEGKSSITLRSLERRPQPRQSKAAWVEPTKVIEGLPKTNGKWTVLRFGNINPKYVNAPAPEETTGWECDKLDPAGIEANFNGYIGRLSEGPLKGLMGGMLVDSWECFCQTWTPKMEQYFREINGYELRPHLPEIFGYILGDSEKTERFLTDWRRTLGKLVTKNYFGRMAELAHAKGLTALYETAFGDIICGDVLEYWKYADEPMCEFWLPHVFDENEGGCGWYQFKPIRPCASAAHIYGKPRVTAEAFTGAKGVQWSEDLKQFRDIANRHFARGVTHLAFQSYTHQPGVEGPKPGDSMGGWNGSPIQRFQTWWKFMPLFTTWLTRCEERLEAGLPANDVLWYLGDAEDHAPNVQYEFPVGYQYDYLNRDVLMNGLRVENGALKIANGTSWKVLWVPDEYRMLPSTRERLNALKSQGAKVVFGDKAVLAAELSKFVPDVSTPSATQPSEDFMWLHRRTDKVDRYFVAAGTNGFAGCVTFRASGVASVYDPVNDTRKSWRNGGALELAPSASVFVEFVKADEFMSASLGSAGTPCTPCVNESRRAQRSRPTNVDINNLHHNKRSANTIALPWKPWHNDPSLTLGERAFAGTKAYTAEFDVTKDNESVWLDLGRVESVAQVFVNDREVATLWCEPFRCDLSAAIKRGKNRLRVEITNTWRNQVIYDQSLPEGERKTWIRHRQNYTPPKDAPFIPAGVVGPATLTIGGF